MKTYTANRELWDRSIKVVEGIPGNTNSYFLEAGPSQKFRNHSPDGFEWGYGGSGPSQLALAILIDLLGMGARDLIQHTYQDFKFAFVAVAAKDGFIITEEQIRNWMADRIEVKA